MLTKSYKFIQNEWSETFDSSMDSETTMILIFFESTLVIDNHLKHIREAFPKSKILGSSTSGEIQNGEINDNSIVCTVVKFAHTRLRLISAPINFKTSAEVGHSISSSLASDELKNILLFTEGLDIDGSELIKEMHKTLNEKSMNVPISGGLAGDGNRFQNTFVIFGDEVKTNHAVALGFYGDHIQIFAGTGTGWDPFGPSRIVTKATGNTVYEIDGIPALKLYREYLKEDAQNLPVSGVLFPLGVSWGKNQNIVRSVARIDEPGNGLIFMSHIPENTKVQLMHSNVIKLIEAAKDALDNCTLNFSNGEPTFALIVSCIGRRMIMGQKTEDELENIRDLLPIHTEISGFYSYGEFAPTTHQQNDLHNQTMTLIVFQEKP